VHVGFGFDIRWLCFLNELGVGLRVFHVEFVCESHAYDSRAFEAVEQCEGLVDSFPIVWSLRPADFSVCLLVGGAEADVELCGFLFQV
jgi:hypothetical protein